MRILKYRHGVVKYMCIAAAIWVCTVRNAVAQKTVSYTLNVGDTTVTYAEKIRHAIAVNGSIPMPRLEFTEGDTAEITVHNNLKVPTSLHWHGIFLPNKEDGVPWLTQKPILPGATYVYKFPLVQSGTHWYHSHSMLQEQEGMYGAFIIHKRAGDSKWRKGIDDLPQIPIVLSEWTNLRPGNVDRMLHNANDWFAIKKGAVQSYGEAIKSGHFTTKLTNEWKRMLAMDVSDVYYDRVLLNGANLSDVKSAGGRVLKGGDKVRLRIANGASSSYFWLRYAGGKITVIASDGSDVEPVEVDRLLIGVSETYDVVVTLPEDGNAYELMATTEDRTQSTSCFIGSGVRQYAGKMPKLKYFEGMKMMNGMMKMNGDLDDMGMHMSLNKMDMNNVMYPEVTGPETNAATSEAAGEHETMHMAREAKNEGPPVTLNYDMLRATGNTALPAGMRVKELHFELTGNMNRYVWSMDGKIMSEVDKIAVNKNEVLRITLYNNSMMRHPMHLHGYDFRVINKHENYAPLKNVLDIMPMETDTIEFMANREGDWFFHCHILYHMMAGMNRVFSVGSYNNPELPDKAMAYRMLQRESNMTYFMAESDFATNGIDGEARLSNARYALNTEWRLGYNGKHGYEVETRVGRYIGKMQWLMPFIGFDHSYRRAEGAGEEKNVFGQRNDHDSRTAFNAGVMYTLPMLINLQAKVYDDGMIRLALMREDIPLGKRLRGGFMVNTDKEYMAELRYIITRNMGLRAHYDSDMGFGVGVALNY